MRVHARARTCVCVCVHYVLVTRSGVSDPCRSSVHEKGGTSPGRTAGPGRPVTPVHVRSCRRRGNWGPPSERRLPESPLSDTTVSTVRPSRHLASGGRTIWVLSPPADAGDRPRSGVLPRSLTLAPTVTDPTTDVPTSRPFGPTNGVQRVLPNALHGRHRRRLEDPSTRGPAHTFSGHRVSG